MDDKEKRIVTFDEAVKSSKSESDSIRPRGGEKTDLDC